MTITRRTLLGSAAVAGIVAAVTGCSSGTGATGPLRFGFWGSELRAASFGEVVELFRAEHPDLEVAVESGTFDAYFDRLAIQVAGNDAPDVISMDFSLFSEYAGRGALADLTGHGIATDDFPTSLVDSGRVDGELRGLAHGMGAAALLANPTVLADLGGAVPDDGSWRWSELIETAADISGSAERVLGLGGRTFTQALAFQSFLAERDGRPFTAEGEIGFTADELAEWWTLMMTAIDSGACGSPQSIVEETALDVDQCGLATGRVAMDSWWSNQLAAMNNAAGSSMALLHPPSQDAVQPPVVLQPTVYWTVSSRSSQPENAVALINFFTGSPAAARIIMTDRGLPGNATARAAIEDQLTEADQAAAEYVGVDGDGTLTPFPPPVGGSAFGEIYGRQATEVMFGRAQPTAAAAAAVEEIAAALR